LAKSEKELLTLNRGVVSKLALGRTDIKRVSMSAQEQTNFIPRVLGPMSLRPGWEYLGNSRSNAQAFYLPFIFATDDVAILELTDSFLRVRVNEVLVTRPSVSSVVANGTFDTNVTSWTDNDEVGGVSDWLTGGYLSLLGNGSAAAIRSQTVAVSAPDQNVQHALNIDITQGECILRVGSTSGGQDYISETTLRPGFHSLAFTPTGASVFIQLMSRLSYATLVNSCVMASAGVMEIATPWVEANLRKIRARQSGDVVFVACRNVLQKRIERRGANSWSVVDYVANQGPFRVANATPLTIAPSALTGTITLTASGPVFKSTNVGGLYGVDSTGQSVTKAIASADNYSDPIRVTGIGAGRAFGITITGTWVGTVTLQRSVGAVGAWVDVTNYTVNQSTSLSDALDNQIIYYRIGIKPANYTSGTATVLLAYAAGSIRGIARITAFTSETVVTAVVVKDFGALTATSDWLEGAWSTRRGFPSAVGIHEGRVWWAGADKIDGSVSDDFANYSDATTGDSGPISRSIGTGPVDTINWLLEGQQLLVGAQGAELICRSTSLGEPLTPTNFNLKAATSRGSLGVDAVPVDTSAVFVDRSGSRAYELQYDNVGSTYTPVDLTSIVPEICEPGVVRVAVQRRADTRLHFVRSDGTVALLVFDKAEDVKAWLPIETDGEVEDAFVLPGTEEDKVYYSVKRVINGSTVRFLERWALQSECVGATLNKQADAFITFTANGSATITGLGHLEGETVVCWADGMDKATAVVAGGSITVSGTVTDGVVGLPYRARFRSVKLSQLTHAKKIDSVGFILADTHARGVTFGQDFDHMEPLPYVEDGEVVSPDKVWGDYEYANIPNDGTYLENTRLCIEANAPRPCTVVAAVLVVQDNGKAG
jgi:hypothetical protein